MQPAPVSPARHQAYASTPWWKLTLRFATRLRWQYLLRFPSNYAWMVLRRKYDAFATDRAYENRPASWLGPFGRWADRRVLDYPVHVSLRQRLALVTEALNEQLTARLDAGGDVRVLSAPSGLCRDLIQSTGRLRGRIEDALDRLDIHCLDIDRAGDVIPEATRRLERAGVGATFYREDLFAPAVLHALVAGGARFEVVNCIGLAAYLSLDEFGRLLAFFRNTLMEPGGTLLVDNFAWHDHSWMGEDLELKVYYHAPEEFAATLRAAGFEVASVRPTENGVNTLYVAIAI